MEKFNLTKSQINKLEKHYGVAHHHLDVDDDGLIHTVLKVDNKKVLIPPHLNSYVKDILKELSDGDTLVLKSKENRHDYNQSKELQKLLGGNSFKRGSGFGSFFTNAWNKTKATVKDAFNKIVTPTLGDIYNQNKARPVVTPVVNSPHVPDLKTCFEMENASYKPSASITGTTWQEILRTQYLACYKNEITKTIMCAFRGTDPKDKGDLVADISIALGSLSVSNRFISDKTGIETLQKTYSPNEWWYAGIGHSLGGAIVDAMIKLGYIKEGVSFNPAVQKEDYDKKTTNRRIYLSSDPLYNLMGRFTVNHEVRQSSKGPLESHSLDSFSGGKRPDGLELHVVIVKKPYDFSEAKEISQKFIKDPKKKFVRETGASYRFRNIPKGRFDPETFVTKKEGKVSLVFGELRHKA